MVGMMAERSVVKRVVGMVENSVVKMVVERVYKTAVTKVAKKDDLSVAVMVLLMVGL